MRKTIATAAGIAALMATAAPAQAQAEAQSGGKRLTAKSAAHRVELAVGKRGGEISKVTCGRPKRGRVKCGVVFTKGAKQCVDGRVMVVRKRGRLKVKGFNVSCFSLAPTPQPTAKPNPTSTIKPPAGMPGPGEGSSNLPLFDPGAHAPAGPPPGGEGSYAQPPRAPAAAARAAKASKRSGQAVARAATNSFLGCSNWVVDPWYRSWWIYVCYSEYVDAPPGAHLIGWQRTITAHVYYWTGSQAAFWFAGSWQA